MENQEIKVPIDLVHKHLSVFSNEENAKAIIDLATEMYLLGYKEGAKEEYDRIFGDN